MSNEMIVKPKEVIPEVVDELPKELTDEHIRMDKKVKETLEILPYILGGF